MLVPRHPCTVMLPLFSLEKLLLSSSYCCYQWFLCYYFCCIISVILSLLLLLILLLLLLMLLSLSSFLSLSFHDYHHYCHQRKKIEIPLAEKPSDMHVEEKEWKNGERVIMKLKRETALISFPRRPVWIAMRDNEWMNENAIDFKGFVFGRSLRVATTERPSIVFSSPVLCYDLSGEVLFLIIFGVFFRLELISTSFVFFLLSFMSVFWNFKIFFCLLAHIRT